MKNKDRTTHTDAFMGRMPGGLLRWSSTALLLSLVGMLAMAWSLRYPETVAAPFKIQRLPEGVQGAIALVPASAILRLPKDARASLHFAAWPDGDCGWVPARVDSVAIDSTSQTYRVYLRLDDGLRTNRGVLLPEFFARAGVAELLTGNPRLIERMVRPIGMLLEKQRENTSNH